MNDKAYQTLPYIAFGEVFFLANGTMSGRPSAAPRQLRFHFGCEPIRVSLRSRGHGPAPAHRVLPIDGSNHTGRR
jgi:hypothetical protein